VHANSRKCCSFAQLCMRAVQLRGDLHGH
jgi:hypothetical protein